MDIHLGTLQIIHAKEHPNLLAPKVADAIAKATGADKVGVVEIDP